MAIWEACRVNGTDPGDTIHIAVDGASFVRILSPSFRTNDGIDVAIVGHGCQIIFDSVEDEP